MTTDSKTFSINLADMSLDELVQVSQGLGHQAEKIREQRRYLNAKIAQRLAAGERNKPAGEAQTIGADDVATIDAAAPGAVIEASAQ